MPGRVVIESFESAVLRGNAAGDPHVRRVPVYLPESYDNTPSRRFPVIVVLTGFTGRGRMLLNDSPFSPALDERLDQLVASGRMRECIVVMPDCYTRFGGSQYMDSSATGRYETHLIDELLPTIDRTYRTLAAREHRAIVGKSSGGFGALRLAMRHPDMFGALGSHSGDMVFDYCYRPELPKACDVLQRAGGAAAFLDRFHASPQKSKDDFVGFEILGMAACYSPDPNAELGVALPFDLATGAFRDEVWRRWLAHDPFTMLASHADALRRMRRIHLDCGSRDEYHLHLGLRLLVRELEKLGIAHTHQEYDDGHMNVSYRYDVSLPSLAEAISA